MSPPPLPTLIAHSLKSQQHREATVYALRLVSENASITTLGLLVEVVRKHTAALRMQGQHDEAAGRLGWLETFLAGQAILVPLPDVPTVLQWADEAGDEARKPIPAPDLRDPKLERALERARKGVGGGQVPASNQAGHRLDEVEELREYALRVAGEPADGDLVLALAREETRLRTCHAFDQAVNEARTWLRHASGQPLGFAAYALQAAEQGIRPIAGLRAELDPTRQRSADKLLDDLREQSDAVARAARDSEAGASWATFRQKHDRLLRTIDNWKPEPKPMQGNRHCAAQVARIGSLGRDLLEEAAKLSGDAAADARQLGEHLQKCAGEAGVAQHRAYNTWAMTWVRKAYESGNAHVSVVLPHEKESLAKVLVEQLAPIDTRFLTSEAARAYSEVFEYLFGKLAGPKNADDFNADGRKLNALARMFEVAKVDLGAF
jgi:hypothetical protein